MPLPLAVLKAAQGRPLMVELKNGDTLSGVLEGSDMYMNLHIRDLVCTSRDGDRFWKIPECYVRGNNVKYMRLPDEVLDLAAEAAERQIQPSRNRRSDWQSSRGGKRRGSDLNKPYSRGRGYQN